MDAKGLLPVFSLPSPCIMAVNGYEEPCKRKPLEEINPWYSGKVLKSPHAEKPKAPSSKLKAQGQ